MALVDCFTDTADHQNDEQVGPEQSKPETLLEAKMTKLKLSCFRHTVRREGSWEKTTCWEKQKIAGRGEHRM